MAKFKMVPIEPTADMVAAARNHVFEGAEAAYAAVLAAAPESPQDTLLEHMIKLRDAVNITPELWSQTCAIINSYKRALS